MSRNRSCLAFLAAIHLLVPEVASGQLGATMDTASMLSSPTLPPEARAAIRERIEAVHAKFRESHGGLGPEQFGLQCCQITQIPAAAFVPDFPAGVWYRFGAEPGYVYPVSSSSSTLWAPVQLPSGVEIQYLDLFHCDTNLIFNVTASLRAFSGGTLLTGPPSQTQLASVSSGGTIGCGYETAALAYTVDNNVAFDAAAAQLAIVVGSPAVDATNQFKAVDLWWMRQVSPAPASPTFNDVAPGDFGYGHIEALAASGITVGCGGGNFCPNAALTRAQMAVFLAKALGLYWPW